MSRFLARLLPDLPGYEPGGGPVIPQAVICREGPSGVEVLLVKRTSPRAWELPGGYMEDGEAPSETLVREVREETGLLVGLDWLVGWYTRTGFRPHRSPVYRCSPVSGAVRRSHEAVAINYFPASRLPLGLFPWYRPAIRDAISGVTHQEAQRQHLGLGAVLVASAIHLAETAHLLP